MSESENNEAVEHQSKNEPNTRKRIRHRKSKLYRNILSQMEFYFSDANLSKDRYLGDLVSSCPYVPLEEFLKFNKIRTLTVDVKDIQKAMKKSSVLELSEDKERIRRKNPMVPYDVDIRTVYVESIPETVNREWLAMVFSDFGRVAYISLPRFRNSQRLKGFGFVEFTCPQDAQKCINAFTKVGLKLPSCMPPEELSSIKTFSVEVKEEVIEDVEEVPKKKPRKHKDIKKLNIESDNEKRLDTPMENKTIDKELKDELTSQDEIKNEDESTRKKKIKKKSKDKVKKFLEKSEAGLWGLQVLSKTEWKVLRNKYLNLQRKNMKELKQTLQEKRRYTGIPAPAAPAVEIDNSTTGQEINRAKLHMERIPGVFVKEVLPEPCLDVKLTKRTIRSNIHALHVEVKEGETEAIIRFDTAKAADDYCANSGSRARVLCSAEEEEQWTRAVIARSNKSQRGLAKLLARSQALSSAPAIAPASPQPTHTHIRFDE